MSDGRGWHASGPALDLIEDEADLLAAAAQWFSRLSPALRDLVFASRPPELSWHYRLEDVIAR